MEKLNEAPKTPPDGGYGWIVVLATVLINISVTPLVQYFGIIYQNDFKNLGITATQTSFLLHLHSAMYCSLGLFSTPLLKKYSFRNIALFGTCIMVIGIFASAFARSYFALICTFSLLVGMGQGIMLPATYMATNSYFKKRLTLAMTFSVTGASIASIFMPQVCKVLLAHFQNSKSTVLVLAAISTIAILCCFLLKPLKASLKSEEITNVKVTNDSSELESLTNDNVYKETTLPVKQENTFFQKMLELFDLQLLKDRCYVVTIIGMSISFASELNVILMLSFILPELAAFNTQDVAFVLSIQSGADLFGRLVIPLMGHYFDVSPKVMYAISLTTSTIGRTVLTIMYSSKMVIYICAGLFGLAKGTKAVYQSVIIPKIVPLDKLPAAYGLNMLLTGGCNLLLGTVIGNMRDLTGSYTYSLHTGSALSMACVLLWVIHYMIWERRKTPQNSNACN